MGEFDDGFEQDEELDEDSMESPLAKEFAQLCTDVGNEMNVHLLVAKDELDKAIALSEKYGVPFNPGICPLSNSYVPASFAKSKFAKLDNDVVSEIADVWGDYLFDGSGWATSSIC